MRAGGKKKVRLRSRRTRSAPEGAFPLWAVVILLPTLAYLVAELRFLAGMSYDRRILAPLGLPEWGDALVFAFVVLICPAVSFAAGFSALRRRHDTVRSVALIAVAGFMALACLFFRPS